MSHEVPTSADGGSAAAQASGPDAPALWQNLTTITGMILTALSVLLLVSFILLSVVRPASNQYIDIVGYMILPALLLLGLLLMPVGTLLKSWRLRRRDPSVRLRFCFPKIDLSHPSQRHSAAILSVLMFASVPVAAISSYQGYHYSDSREFCANACHGVMQPQAVTHAISAHARIACAECHVGSGARWFLHYKLAGARQLWSYVRGTYERPVPVAIQELRPSRDTCEKCHWPERFFDSQLRTFTHFASDEKNTAHNVKMMLRTGGADGRGGKIEGIHRHMLDLGAVEFVATDDKVQDVPWVKWTDPEGRERIYRSDGQPSSAAPPDGTRRTMDCMDCHNRTGHNFLSADEAVNIYMRVGKIDHTLPYIKRQAITALRQEGLVAIAQDQPDIESGAGHVEQHMVGFYRSEYPERWTSDQAAVLDSAAMIAAIYREEWFPHMKAYWREYLDNSGHYTSPGCLRCHDGKHVDDAGEAISHRCTMCHTYITKFQHPLQLDATHTTVRCDQCHTGGLSPDPTCAGCHVQQADFIAGRSPEFERFQIQPDSMAAIVECEGCHDTSEVADIEIMNEACLDCHDDEAERYDGMVQQWKTEMDRLLEAAEPGASAEDLELLGTLRRAGPLHNIEASRSIMSALTKEPG